MLIESPTLIDICFYHGFQVNQHIKLNIPKWTILCEMCMSLRLPLVKAGIQQSGQSRCLHKVCDGNGMITGFTMTYCSLHKVCDGNSMITGFTMTYCSLHKVCDGNGMITGFTMT